MVFSWLTRRPRSRERAPPSKMERFVFVMKLCNHLEELPEALGSESWAAFSDELFHRILPAVAHKGRSFDVEALEQVADSVRELCMKWPTAVERFQNIAARTAECAAGLLLPRKWSEKQALLNEFEQLYKKLGIPLRKCQAETKDVALPCESGASSKGFMEVGLYFCSVRKPTGLQTLTNFFGTERAAAPATGVVKVSLPDFDNVASNSPQLPFLWQHSRKRATGNSSKSLEISRCAVLDIQHHMADVVGRAGTPREAVVFVHGFNCHFKSAAKRMALYAYKLHRDMPFFIFTWPSFQSIDIYSGDEANAMWAVPFFTDFLKQLMTAYGLNKVHVLAHSMGARIALYSLAGGLAAWKPPRGAARLGQLVLAAPDFDTGEFWQMQGEVGKRVEGINVYCSSNDQALRMSARVHGGLPRLGHFSVHEALLEASHVALSDKVAIIDATGLDKSIIGHSYVFTHHGVIRDVCQILFSACPPERRPALRMEEIDGCFRYWRFVSFKKEASDTEDEVESRLGCEKVNEDST